MTALTVRLPNSVHQKIKELAERDNISVNQFIASAAAEKMASVLTLDHLKSEAAKGNRGDFDVLLGLVSRNSMPTWRQSAATSEHEPEKLIC